MAVKLPIGDLGEFWHGDFKEPVSYLPWSYQGAFREGALPHNDAFQPLCAHCGKAFDNLGIHVSAVHGQPASEYKAEVGLLQKHALVSEGLRQKMVAKALRNGSRPPRQTRPNKAAGRNYFRGAYWLNKTGRCYDQVLALGRSLQAAGKRVTVDNLGRHGITRERINLLYGGMDDFRRLLSEPTPPSTNGRWTDADLIGILRRTAEEIGRTPTFSDLRRMSLPTAVYGKRFGSYREACRKAGLPANLSPELNGEQELAVLNAYAVTGSVSRTARTTRHADFMVKKVLDRYGIWWGPFPRDSMRLPAQEFAATVARRLAGMPGDVAA